ncbi:MAG: SUMF1/EgtB/PvdO family nonheme iron enzyme [Phormidesmis sp.]
MRSPASVQASSVQALLSTIQDCRAHTLSLIKGIQPEVFRTVFRTQSHPDFSPVGWHLGHIAYTESLWIAEHLGGGPCPFPQYEQLFAADGLPKAQRQNLPVLAEVLAYLAEVRSHTKTYLQAANLRDNIRLWHWLIQHESQHAETISMVLAMHRHPPRPPGTPPKRGFLWAERREAIAQSRHQIRPTSHINALTEMVFVEAGEFYQGSDAPDAIDNERSVHPVSLESYWVDRAPVTCGQYRRFIAAGGYEQRQWWSQAGWQWQQWAKVTQPLYWTDDWAFEHHPVCGVSWYEADAYARSVGKRLPSELEWAKAAGWNAISQKMQRYPWGDALNEAACNYGHQVGSTTPVKADAQSMSPYGCIDMIGNVWEWTDTWFGPYPGFRAFPYEGYSQVYFDQAHRVLRGGSWATPPWALRNSFRNWYHPHRREVFAGFRCAR